MQERKRSSCDWKYPSKTVEDCMNCTEVVTCEFVKSKCQEEGMDLHKFYRIVTYNLGLKTKEKK